MTFTSVICYHTCPAGQAYQHLPLYPRLQCVTYIVCHCSFVFQTQTQLITDVSGNFHLLIDELERTLFKRRLTLKNKFNWFSLHFVLFQMLVPIVGWKIGSDYNLNSYVHFVAFSYTNVSFAFFFRCHVDIYSSLLSMFIHFTRIKE